MTWQFDSSASSLLVKALLLASATETNESRENLLGDPVLGRSASPKDRFEGYGLMNPDAAIEAATLVYDGAPFTGAVLASEKDRRAWGRKMTVPAGRTLKLVLDVSKSADLDLHVYSGADAKGNPSLVASSARGYGEDEVLTWTAPTTSDVHVFVKLIAGYGSFTLSGSMFTCGDGALEPGEECEGAKPGSQACCSPTCQFEPATKSCDDANACTGPDHCNAAGECITSPVVCSPSSECSAAACVPASGCVSTPVTDGTPCDGGACVAGACSTPDAGVAPESEALDGGSLVDGSPASSDRRAVGNGCACELTSSRAKGANASLSVACVVACVLLGRRRTRRVAR
jgi:hypothetical protein